MIFKHRRKGKKDRFVSNDSFFFSRISSISLGCRGGVDTIGSGSRIDNSIRIVGVPKKEAAERSGRVKEGGVNQMRSVDVKPDRPPRRTRDVATAAPFKEEASTSLRSTDKNNQLTKDVA